MRKLIAIAMAGLLLVAACAGGSHAKKDRARFDTFKAMLDKVVAGLPPVGTVRATTCSVPVSEPIRYTSDQMEAQDNNIAFAMDEQVLHPGIKLDGSAQFDLDVPPARTNLPTLLDVFAGSLTGSDPEDQLPVLRAELVVISRSVRYETPTVGAGYHSLVPGSIWLESFVAVAATGKVVCSLRTDAKSSSTVGVLGEDTQTNRDQAIYDDLSGNARTALAAQLTAALSTSIEF